MASWVTRCWSPASVAGVARPEPDVPEAPLVRPDGGFPSQGRTSFAILPVKCCFSVKWRRGRKLLPVIGKDDAVLLRPCQDRGGGFLVLEPHANQSLPGSQLVD